MLCVPIRQIAKPRTTPPPPLTPQEAAFALNNEITSYLYLHFNKDLTKNERVRVKELRSGKANWNSGERSLFGGKCDCLDFLIDWSKGHEAIPEATKALLPIFMSCRLKMKTLNDNRQQDSRRDYLKQVLEACKTSKEGGGALYKHKINLHEGLDKAVPVCGYIFRRAYDVKPYEMKLIKGLIHENVLTAVPEYNNHSTVAKETYQRIYRTLESSALLPEDNDLSLMLLPNSESAHLAHAWLADRFSIQGDYNPTNREIHLEALSNKQDLYNEYRNEMENYINEEPIGLNMFLYIWDLCFSHVKIRKYKAVTGKCLTCAILTDLRSKTKNREHLEIITVLHALHKYTYMKCRRCYYANIVKAIESPNQYMSIIMDGMSQTHTELPFLANQKNFSHLHQHLFGIKEHGKKFVIYRSYANVVNLAIYCLLSQIENRLQRCGNLPPTLFIQVDGGSENANETVLAVCEYLVMNKIFKNVYLTRLPVGHTHEDIDAMFGKIWTYIRQLSITSPQEYAKILYEIFGKNKDAFDLVDVLVVPSYTKLFEKCIDTPKRFAKEELTQLAWRFESHNNSCRTMYKKYPCDEVYELINDETDENVPYQGIKTICKTWQPTASPQYGIQKTGIRIITTLPFGHILPSDFHSNHRATFDSCFASVVANLTKEAADDWREFEKLYPKTSSAMDYITVEKGRFHFPLAEQLFPDIRIPPKVTNVGRSGIVRSDFTAPAPITRKVAANIVQYATPAIQNSVYKGIQSRSDPNLYYQLPPFIPVSVGEEQERMEQGKLDIEEKLREMHSIPLYKAEKYNAFTVEELKLKIHFRKLEGKAKNKFGGISKAKKAMLVNFLLEEDNPSSDSTMMEID